VKGLIRDEGWSREFGRLGVWAFGNSGKSGQKAEKLRRKSGQTLVNTLVKLSNSGENFGVNSIFFVHKL